MSWKQIEPPVALGKYIYEASSLGGPEIETREAYVKSAAIIIAPTFNDTR
jgi:hypothetical protein